MLYEAMLETFEETALRVQKVLSSMKEQMHWGEEEMCKVARMAQDEPRDAGEILGSVKKMQEHEKEIERVIRELVVFLDIQSAEVRQDAESFKEMVCKAGMRSRLENISCVMEGEMWSGCETRSSGEEAIDG